MATSFLERRLPRLGNTFLEAVVEPCVEAALRHSHSCTCVPRRPAVEDGASVSQRNTQRTDNGGGEVSPKTGVCALAVPVRQGALARQPCRKPKGCPATPAAITAADVTARAIECVRVTTLMIRNLPPQLRQCQLLDKLDRSGFEGLYDFVYLPCSFTSGLNKGFAFVNMVSAGSAKALMAAWHKGTCPGFPNWTLTLNIAPADVQGRKANLAKWGLERHSRVKNRSFRPFVLPALFEQGSAMTDIAQ